MKEPMTLRELINRLEVLSKKGRNDNLPVHAVGYDEVEMDVTNAWINRFVGSVEEFEFVEIELN